MKAHTPETNLYHILDHNILNYLKMQIIIYFFNVKMASENA